MDRSTEQRIRHAANTVDLGDGGGAKLKAFLEREAQRSHRSLAAIVKAAYKSKGGDEPVNAYDTVKKWFAKEGSLRVRADILESVLREVGHTLHDYPHLPETEKKRLMLEYPQDAFARLGSALADFEIVDLSHEIRGVPSCSFRWDQIPVTAHLTQGESSGIRFNTTIIDHLPTNYGTHIDFPGHIATEKIQPTVSTYSLSQFVLEAAVVDVRDLTSRLFRSLDSGSKRLRIDVLGKGKDGVREFFDAILSLEITREEFLRRCKQPLRGKAVLFCTGLDQYWRYETQPGWRYAYFLNPFLSGELAQHLVDEGTYLVGCDSLQLECPLFNISVQDDFAAVAGVDDLIRECIDTRIESTVHEILLKNSICIVENLTGLHNILPGPVIFAAAPLKLGHPVCADNSPTRALALVPRARHD